MSNKPERVFADFSEVTLAEGRFLTSLTWIEPDGDDFIPHHYFIDYPGARQLERQITEAIGGKPLVRYSAVVVLKAFMNSLGTRRLGLRNPLKIESFVDYLTAHGYTHVPPFTLYSDNGILSVIEEIREEASKKFGNAL